jgi:hypothetical protein
MQQWNSRVETIEGYLDRNFASAFIRSKPQHSEARQDAHTFQIEQNRRTYTLAICRDFIENFDGDTRDYLDSHRVAETLRQMGSARVVLTKDGLRTDCGGSAVSTPAKKRPGGKTAPLTAEERHVFLEALAEHGNVSFAAERGGKSRACFYHHRKLDPEFKAAWDDARRRHRGRNNRVTIREEEARRRGVRTREVNRRFGPDPRLLGSHWAGTGVAS